MRISDWSSDVCSSDLPRGRRAARRKLGGFADHSPLPDRLALHFAAQETPNVMFAHQFGDLTPWQKSPQAASTWLMSSRKTLAHNLRVLRAARGLSQEALADAAMVDRTYISAIERQKYSVTIDRSEGHTSALQSLMRTC